MDQYNLGKPIAGGGSGLVGHTVPMAGFDQGEHGAGTGVSGGHVPSSSNQARGYGEQSDFNHGLGGEHASGGLPSKTPIADKFTGGHSSGSDAVSGAYAGGGTRDALTGESNAHTTGAGVGPLAENLRGTGHSHEHGSSHTSSRDHTGATGYGGSINRSADTAHTGTARDAALTATAGSAAASALGPGAHTGTGVGAQGGSGGHYSTGHSGTTGDNLNTGTGAAAGVLAGQQAGARGTHGDSGITSSHGTQGAAAAGVGAGAAGAGAHHSSSHDDSNSRGTPLSDPKDLDSGSRHGLVFDKSTGKYVHRHELDEKK